MRSSRLLSPWLSIFLGCACATAQAVIATHSGTVNFSEGEVFLDDHPLDQKVATFPSIQEGSTFRTQNGRAEILLEPGVFLRVDQNTAIRMVSTDLSKTRIAFLSGAVILDSNDRPEGSSLILDYKSYHFRFPKPGIYRVNAEPGILETYSGEAEVASDGQSAPKKIDSSHEFFFDIGMLTPKYGDGTLDAFSEWARQRSEAIAAANRAEQDAGDPADLNSDPLYGSVPYSAGSTVPGLAPGYGSITGPLAVSPAPYYGVWDLYSSAWGSPFLFPNTFVYILPVYYRRYPFTSKWPHRSGYPVLSQSQLGMGLTQPSRLSFPASTPRVGLLSPASPRVGVAVPHYTAPAAVHSAAPRAMVHR